MVEQNTAWCVERKGSTRWNRHVGCELFRRWFIPMGVAKTPVLVKDRVVVASDNMMTCFRVSERERMQVASSKTSNYQWCLLCE